ncbi:hypothetical protein [Poseidonocella pacifica]|uniref:hypothetical protein n=1 Tax=Poseidonocella pacifica TaxID=871651 RepID=UPI0011144BC1|nr:hypothetical protein [Poseidonocella pacifica]
MLGRLGGSALAAMNAVRGRIHAERDIATERRAERRSRAAVGRGRSFTVERRAPRCLAVAGKAVQQ